MAYKMDLRRRASADGRYVNNGPPSRWIDIDPHRSLGWRRMEPHPEYGVRRWVVVDDERSSPPQLIGDALSIAFEIVDAEAHKGWPVGINFHDPSEETDLGDVDVLVIYPSLMGWTLLACRAFSADSKEVGTASTREIAVRAAYDFRGKLPGRQRIEIYPPQMNVPISPWDSAGVCHNSRFPK